MPFDKTEPFYWIWLIRGQSVPNCIISSQNRQRSIPVLF